MYTQEVNIGDLKDRPVFENWSYTQDAGGGNIKHLDNSFYVWSKIEDGGGRQFINSKQQTWSLDLKLTIRYTTQVNHKSTFIWGNDRFTINSLTITNNRFIEIGASKIDGNLVSPEILPPVVQAYVYNYEAVGGESGFTNSSLIGKTIIGAYKDGIAYKVVTGTPDVKEVKYTSSTGEFEFGNPFYDGEVAIIQYI